MEGAQVPGNLSLALPIMFLLDPVGRAFDAVARDIRLKRTVAATTITTATGRYHSKISNLTSRSPRGLIMGWLIFELETKMSNTASHRSVGLRKFMQKRAFADGFKDFRSGRSWRADDYGINSIAYEYGRHFALVWDGAFFKDGNTIRTEAVYAFNYRLTYDGVIE